MTTPPEDPRAAADGSSEPGPGMYSAVAADRKLVMIPLIAVVVAGTITTIVAAVLAGGKGLIAGLVGSLVVLAFFGISQAVLVRVSRNNPAIAMNVALLTYVLQILFLFILLILLQDATFFAPRAFAWAIVVCALTWTITAVTVLARSKVLYVEPGSGPGQPPSH